MNPWKGREILGLDPTASLVRSPRLGSKPRLRAEVSFDGERRDVRCIAGEGVVVIVLDAAQRIEPGRRWLLDGRPLLLLLAIDELDASRRAHLARRLPAAVMEARTPADAVPTNPSEPAPRTDAPSQTAPFAYLPHDVRRLAERLAAIAIGAGEASKEAEAPGLSPAAVRLLGELRRASGIVPHLSALQKRRLAPVAEELLRKGHLLELEHGHLIDRATFVELAQTVRGAGEPVNAPGAAARWGCSRGRARALLDRMVLEGVLEREQGWFRVHEGSPDE